MASSVIFPSARSPFRWRQMLGLTAVQSAISLMWVIYGAYVPQLLEQFGMPISLALAIAFQPLMERWFDGAQRWVGVQPPCSSGLL